MGLELEERGRSSKNSFFPRDPLLLGLFSTSNNLWQRARVGQEGLGALGTWVCDAHDFRSAYTLQLFSSTHPLCDQIVEIDST
ncbi:hypothetical protein Taro_011466 [Colocasia esculenta]|uniref:Uncharacterized protein n=1 Tax=Colocasia esculenta TaxID=4460 RepID=A0A843UCP9_COLES|nr:hypothetical protein [Colocasia esculenta]